MLHFEKGAELQENGAQIGIHVIGGIAVALHSRVQTLEEFLVDIQQNGDISKDTHDQLLAHNSLSLHRVHKHVDDHSIQSYNRHIPTPSLGHNAPPCPQSLYRQTLSS